MSERLLEVEDLSVEFATEGGVIRAVEEVSFGIDRGATLGIVGESGCGKSVTSLALMGLLPRPAGRVVGGSVRFDGAELIGLDESRLRKLRGSEISMVFQEPLTALNPVYTIGRQIAEVARRHLGLSRSRARERAIEMLARVGIPLPDRRIDEYPHELSGGMRQRAMIAMALVCRPKLLIADEPTTALDVTTQAQVLEQIVTLQREFGTAVILITHDLGVVAETCRDALVMYCGEIVERAATEHLFNTPRHRYTQRLLEAMPRIRSRPLTSLPVIPGSVPEPDRLPSGCRFAPRCAHSGSRCELERPRLQRLEDSDVACFYPANVEADGAAT